MLHSMRVWKVRTDALDYTGDRLLETYLYSSRELKEYMLEYRVACSSGSRLPNLAFEAMNLLPQGLLMISHVSICISIRMIHGWMSGIKGSRRYRWMSCEAAIGTTQGPTILAAGSVHGQKDGTNSCALDPFTFDLLRFYAHDPAFLHCTAWPSKWTVCTGW